MSFNVLNLSNPARGNLLAALSFVLWGILPLYYQLLPGAEIFELLAFRVIWSVPVMVLAMVLLGRALPDWKTLWADKRSVLLSFVAGLVMCISWASFTWALTHGQVLAASLGFFINPLFAIALGVLFLHEKLSRAQGAAVVLAALGIIWQVWHYGELPWVSLAMGSFFALYGLIKKFIRFDSFTTVTLEAALLAPFALIYLGYLVFTGQSAAGAGGLETVLLYIGSAPVTLAPLILFSLALRYTSLTMVGLMQYIEPTLQFLLAVLLFGEVFDEVKAVSFGFIWAGLLLCSLEALPALRRHLRRA
ncbi:EamA family transporter RarD [Ferrimonas balearica]|uniref:EamA family transporter RarD n=1 Tax=Ferrimonas balearica TaxID=44012 RepID=UPI001C9A0F1E|nr:EamA family transporter RarD [Ferrimonas balearica]MBY5921022.1 EamA family transporter RarD [Ferrimonas balearica]MBY5996293.1 EamA family transporter RarD [Ferrimonas balearica]